MGERLIHVLPEQVASQIAAGEVVERPASVVKELVENALDARARTVEIEIERGGLGLVAVSDDGSGMGREDAILSLRRHATSKIRGGSDLVAIRTLGFRGEALASIASVARVRLATRRPPDPHGVELVVSGGDIEDERACAMAPGTRVEVRDLFFNTPARLKFMKTLATEQGAVAEVVQRIALANRAVAFRLRADGREIFALARAAAALERMRQIFGAKLASKMLGFSAGRSGLGVSGLAAMSQESFASPRMIFTFVNGRVVRDKMLSRAVAQAYQTLMPRGRHPAVVLFIELRHDDVDVNVHPMKSEVRFKNPGAVFELVYHALRQRLADQTAAAAPAPERSSAAAPAAVEAQGAGAMPDPAPLQTPSRAPANDAAGDERPLRLVVDAPASPQAQTPLNLGYGRPAQRTGGTPGQRGAVPMYSQLRLIGQIFAGYIVLESEEGLILVDQHAAHERVTFERLRAELKAGGIRTQAMLAPALIELSPARAGHAQALIPSLCAMGFDIEQFGPTTLRLKGTPAIFGPEAGAKLLSDMIDTMSESGTRPSGDAAFEGWLKQLACHGSVRVGRVLDEREIHELLSELDRTEFKTNCPHGRPVHISFARGRIEWMFRR
jgi:DNA mismatch repair protein MutL